MHRERLELLMKRLELEQQKTNPTENFDMSTWASDRAKVIDGAFIPKCGTSACAAGLATTVPELRAAGLKLEKRERIGFYDIWYRGERNEQALLNFFEIDGPSAERIFYPWGDEDGGIQPEIQPIQVADRIRELLAKP